MPKDLYYLHLLQQCQAAELERRLEALEDLRGLGYADLLTAQFLLDRLNSTSNWQEQSAIVGLMYEIKEPLPVQALMAILEDAETSTQHLRIQVAHILAAKQAEEAFDPLLRLMRDPDEDLVLREMITFDLPDWGERITDEFLLALLDDPDLDIAALEVWRSRPPETIPLDRVVKYCTDEESGIREVAIKTLVATEHRIPLDLILAALNDPEPQVRAVASHSCMSLVEWFRDQLPLEPLLQALHDEYAAVREDILDTFGKMPLRIPVEPVIAALTDPVPYVRCAALETLGVMGERVPSSIYPALREMSGSDSSANVRQRATRALLLLHGLTPPPLLVPIVDLTLEQMEKYESDENF